MAETRTGVLVLDGWSGRSDTPVAIVGETPSHYRIAPPEGVARVRLGGRMRWLSPGETALVPKTAVTLTKAPR